MINGHGDERLNDGKKPFLNFSNTVWYGADHTLLGEHLSRSLVDCMRHYPEPDAATLRKMIARRHGLNEESIIVTNGPTQAIYLLAEAFAEKRILIPSPAFAEYEDAARLYRSEVRLIAGNTPISEWPLDEVDVCYIATPNNPDGHIISHAELMLIIDKYPKVTFILDQCYANYTTVNKIKPSDSKSHPNLISFWSFSHAYGIPGLRIGYIVAPSQYSEVIRRLVVPWSVNSIAIEAAKYILIHPAQFTLPIRKWQRSAQELMTKLSAFNEIDVLPSTTTFFLIKLKKCTAAALKEYLATEHNMLIRDASNFAGLDASYARITSLDEASNNQLVNAIALWLEQQA